jgi:hypothetical protein
MKTKLLVAAALLSVSFPTAADFETVELAYEVALSEIRLPRNHRGTIAFKKCSDCEYLTKRVSENIRYMVDGRAVTLEKFRQLTESVADRDNEAVTIMHHLEDNRVTEVSVYL